MQKVLSARKNASGVEREKYVSEARESCKKCKAREKK